MNIKLADRLVALRKEKGFSQEELADRLGISRQAVSKWEQALSSPDLDNLVSLAQLYGLTLDELVRVEAPEADACPGEGPDEGTKLFVGQAPAAPRPPEAGPEPRGVPDGAEGPAYPAEAIVKQRRQKNWGWLFVFPYPVVAALAFLILGFGWGLWHPGWIVFLTIPVYYTVVTGLTQNRPLYFAVPVICILVYFILGIFFYLWHPGWIILLVIPLYYAASSGFEEHHRVSGALRNSYPILAVLVFFVLGACFNLWHPGWLVFVTIPIFYGVLEAYNHRAEE